MHIVVPTKSGLPAAEHNFCHYLIADPQMNVTQAYLKLNPNIKPKSASMAGAKFLKKPEIRDYIGKLLADREKRMEMDEDWVILNLRNIHDRCMQFEGFYANEPFDEEGNPVDPIYVKFDASGALKALELIGKHMKMFSDKTDSTATEVAVNINLGNDKPAIEGKFRRDGTNRLSS